MTKHNRMILIYSAELSNLSEDFQKEAVQGLRDYVRAHEGVWEYKEGKRMDEAFEPFFNDKIQLVKQFADAYGILFQPEVIRGDLNEEQIKEVELMGFEVLGLKF